MISLHLSSSFAPVPDTGLAFNAFTFNGGEPHFRLAEPLTAGTEVLITIRLNGFQDVGLLLVATDALRRAGAGALRLFVPYFPGARQDRVMTPGEPLTVNVYADLLNAQGYARVTVFDPHSDVTPALLDRAEALDNHAFVRSCLADLEPVTLVAPDGGALKKIYKLSDALGGLDVLECSKKRDVKTGALSGFRVPEADLGGRSFAVVDDICDGGGTFVGLAEALKAHGAGDLYLVVSHGLFSRGFDELGRWFRGVFTTNSIRDRRADDPEFLTVKPLSLP